MSIKDEITWMKITTQNGKVIEVPAKSDETAFYSPLGKLKILRKVQVEEGFITKSYMKIGEVDRNLLGFDPKTGRLKHLKTITAFQSQQAVKQKGGNKQLTNYFDSLKIEFQSKGYKNLIFIQNGDTLFIEKKDGEKTLFKADSFSDGKLLGNYPGYKQLNFTLLDGKKGTNGCIYITNVLKMKHYSSNFYSKINL